MPFKTSATISSLTALSLTAAACIGISIFASPPQKQAAAKTSLRSGPPRFQIEHASSVLSVAWSTDGKWLAAGTKDGTVRITEAATGKTIHNLATKLPVSVVAFAPDGKMLGISQDGHTVSMWNISTGKEGNNGFGLGGGRTIYPIDQMAFAPDGQTIMGIGYGSRYLWMDGKGNNVAASRPTDRGSSSVAPDASIGGWCDIKGLCRMYEVQVGRPMRTLKVGGAGAIAFGPAVKLLAVAGTDSIVRLWDLATEKETVKLTGLGTAASKLSFAADGKTLAAASGEDPMICVWELSQNSVRCLINHNRGVVGSMALSPDGQMLATTIKDSNTLLLWKVAPREPGKKGPPLDLSAKELLELWTDLNSVDHDKADQAWSRLHAAGGKAIPFLRQQIRAIAVPPADMKAIEKQLADLDSREFVVRENASKDLSAAGDLAVLPLQRLLEKTTSAEAKERARILLQKIGEPPLTPDFQRVMHAIDLLELLHSAEATALLQEIQRDALIASIHREAHSAIRRLAPP